jgi:hypothetical protein
MTRPAPGLVLFSTEHSQTRKTFCPTAEGQESYTTLYNQFRGMSPTLNRALSHEASPAPLMKRALP